jgi:hypothetical protein
MLNFGDGIPRRLTSFFLALYDLSNFDVSLHIMKNLVDLNTHYLRAVHSIRTERFSLFLLISYSFKLSVIVAQFR